MNRIFNASVVIAGLVALAGAQGSVSEVVNFASPDSLHTIAFLSAIFAVGFAIWVRTHDRVPSRDMLRRVADVKQRSKSGSGAGPLWGVSWTKKIAWTAFSGSVAAIPEIASDLSQSAIVISKVAAISFVIGAIYVASYAALFLIGRLVRKAMPGLMTDNREAFVTWAIVVVGIGAAIYFPASRDIAYGVTPMAILAGWIREVDILRTGMPIKALVFVSSDIGGIASSACRATHDVGYEDDDGVNVGRLMSDPAYRALHPFHPVSQAHSDDN